MTVAVSDVRKAVEILLKHLAETDQSEFEIVDDFYWDIPASARYDPYLEPKATHLGQLSDDVKDLRRICNGERSPLGCDLVWLSAIMRRIGEKSLG